MVQFDTIIFGRTFKNYFGQFVWIEKSHYNSRVSLHEAPTKNLQTDHIGQVCRILQTGILQTGPNSIGLLYHQGVPHLFWEFCDRIDFE